MREATGNTGFRTKDLQSEAATDALRQGYNDSRIASRVAHWYEGSGVPESGRMRRRILIADDHEIVRKGLKSLLAARIDWQVCGEASSGLEAIEKSVRLDPDVIVMDVSMPDMDGLEAARGILKSRPEQKIVMYSMHESDAFTCAAMRAGAQGAVGKSDKAEELFHAIDVVLHGQQFFPAIGLLLN